MTRSWKKNNGRGVFTGQAGDFLIITGVAFFFGYGLVLRVSAGGHLHRDVGEESPPSGGVLLGLESDIGRGTGRATGGGGGSKKEPGILLWPLPFGCRQHKKVQEGDMRQSADRGMKRT